MTTHREIRVGTETPRWRRVAGALFWTIFFGMTLSGTMYQLFWADDGAGWLMLTFLVIFSVLLLWASVEAWQRVRKS